MKKKGKIKLIPLRIPGRRLTTRFSINGQMFTPLGKHKLLENYLTCLLTKQDKRVTAHLSFVIMNFRTKAAISTGAGNTKRFKR